MGRLIADRLAPGFPGRVVLAGRNRAKAQSAAAAIGHGVEGRHIDVLDTKGNHALDEVRLVLSCLDQADTKLVEQCLARGIDYVDISANYEFLLNVAKFDSLAKQENARVLLSVGVAPGLTNMLAARLRSRMESVDRIDILLEIGLGDDHGKAAVEWMFDSFDSEFQVLEAGQLRSVRSFDESMSIRLPGQAAKRSAYRFGFPDQLVIARSLDVPTVSTWVRFDNRMVTWLFAKASRAGLGCLLRLGLLRKLAVWLFMKIHWGSDICGIGVRAMGRSSGGSQTLILGVIGRREAVMTAIVAAESVRQLLSGRLEPGVYHSDQAIALNPVVSALKNEIPDLVVVL